MNIVTYDVRMEDHILKSYKGHQEEICGLKWDESYQHLASSGKEGTVCVWDVRKTSSRWIHRFQNHSGSSSKALAWFPFRSLLASAGGEGGRHLMFWNTLSGKLVKSFDTGCLVSEIIWSKHGMELLTSHGSPGNQLTIWEYDTMTKIAELKGHTSRILSITRVYIFQFHITSRILLFPLTGFVQ